MELFTISAVQRRSFISAQPPSKGREGALGDINVQLEQLAKQRAGTFFSRPNEIVLLTIRSQLNDSHLVKHQEEETKIVESEDRKLEQKLQAQEPESEEEQEKVMQDDRMDPNESLEGPELDEKVEVVESEAPMKFDGPIKVTGSDSLAEVDKDFDNEDTV